MVIRVPKVIRLVHQTTCLLLLALAFQMSYVVEILQKISRKNCALCSEMKTLLSFCEFLNFFAEFSHQFFVFKTRPRQLSKSHCFLSLISEQKKGLFLAEFNLNFTQQFVSSSFQMPAARSSLRNTFFCLFLY